MSYKMKKVGTAHGVDLYVPCDSHGPDIRGTESIAQYASNMRRQQKEPEPLVLTPREVALLSLGM